MVWIQYTYYFGSFLLIENLSVKFDNEKIPFGSIFFIV